MPELDPFDVAAWCQRELGAGPSSASALRGQMSDVTHLTLTDGRDVVLKRRQDPLTRVQTCLDAQRYVAERGFAAPMPLSAATAAADEVMHAEEWRPGGVIMQGDDPVAAEKSGHLLAQLMALLTDLQPDVPPLPNPSWVAWDYDGHTGWPPHTWLDARPQRRLPQQVSSTAAHVRRRMATVSLPKVLGHADWEAQNLRWDSSLTTPRVVHDWDSLAWLPEAAIVGAAAGAFASNEVPMLAPLDSSATFLAAYQDARGHRFSDEEVQVAWAASLWPALHNARAEFLCEREPVAGRQVDEQATARLRLAGVG